jgi:hypothetical protein
MTSVRNARKVAKDFPGSVVLEQDEGAWCFGKCGSEHLYFAVLERLPSGWKSPRAGDCLW